MEVKKFKLLISFGFLVLVFLVVIVGYTTTKQSAETRSRAATITNPPQPTITGAGSWFIEFLCGSEPASYMLTSSVGCKDQQVWIKEASDFCNTKGSLPLSKYNLGPCQQPVVTLTYSQPN
ncbi:hypothetical protein HY029_02915 [Candidatus Gottesmanbacteria bacterium]|nr:hypothetical protein [Candidatus Gottesmanbacteria bacterium]